MLASKYYSNQGVNMKRVPKFLPVTAVIFTASLLSAHAQDSGSTEIEITGKAQPVCTLSPSAQTAGANANYANNRLTISNLIDPTTAKINSAAAEITFSEVMCNYKAVVSLSTLNAGLVPAVPVTNPDGTFLTKVPYTVTGSWGNFALPTLNTATAAPASAVIKEADGARRNSLVLNFATVKSDAPLVAGDFSDVLELKVGAAP
jgi:hypothetical protein